LSVFAVRKGLQTKGYTPQRSKRGLSNCDTGIKGAFLSRTDAKTRGANADTKLKGKKKLYLPFGYLGEKKGFGGWPSCEPLNGKGIL